MAGNQPTLFDSEIWKPVPGFEGIYEVSNMGQLRSLDRVLSSGRRWKGRILKQSLTWNGYFYLNLSKDGIYYRRYLHRLVLEAFVGPSPEGMEACHENGVRGDNRPENLRWDTRTENVKDAIKHGTHHWASKTHCPRGHELAQPNLVPSGLRYGRRNCLACSRTRAYIKNHPHLKAHFKKVSDSYHEAIINPDAQSG